MRVAATQAARLEAEIDRMNAGLAPLRSFVLPGGGRSPRICTCAAPWRGRAERLTVALAGAEPVNPEAIRYLNRLSRLVLRCRAGRE